MRQACSGDRPTMWRWMAATHLEAEVTEQKTEVEDQNDRGPN